MDSWTIRSATVEATVNALGGMVAPVFFTLPDGRRVQPFKIAGWAERAEARTMPPVTRYLRGEFVCVPFGAPAPPPSAPAAWRRLFTPDPSFDETHGYCANHRWSLVADGPDSITVGIDYPDAHSVRRVEKTVRAADDLEFALRVHARRHERISIGIHPVFDVGEEPGGAEIDAPFRFGRTFPGDYAPGVSRFARDARFESLGTVPLRTGGVTNISRLPLAVPTEEVVQLCGTQGVFRLTRGDPACTVELRWDRGVWPSLLLGIANGGRQEPPYDGRWRALYVEPVAAAFGMGSSVGANPDNPIALEGVATSVELDPAMPWTTTYRLSIDAGAAS